MQISVIIWSWMETKMQIQIFLLSSTLALFKGLYKVVTQMVPNFQYGEYWYAPLDPAQKYPCYYVACSPFDVLGQC